MKTPAALILLLSLPAFAADPSSVTFHSAPITTSPPSLLGHAGDKLTEVRATPIFNPRMSYRPSIPRNKAPVVRTVAAGEIPAFNPAQGDPIKLELLMIPIDRGHTRPKR